MTDDRAISVPVAPIVATEDAWSAFADLDVLPPATEWQLRWYGFDKAWQA